MIQRFANLMRTKNIFYLSNGHLKLDAVPFKNNCGKDCGKYQKIPPSTMGQVENCLVFTLLCIQFKNNTKTNSKRNCNTEFSKKQDKMILENPIKCSLGP